MIIVNTTFHIPLQLKNMLAGWLRDTYAPSALNCGLDAPRTARVLGGGDDDSCSVAFQTQAPTLAIAKKWHDGEGQRLRQRLLQTLGADRVAFFTTYLQTID